MRVALLFPGQGAQTPGFLHRLPQHAAVEATLAEAAAVLGAELAELDSAPALESTGAVQLGTLIAGVAVARALEAQGLRPDAVAGLSVGAFSAAVACGALGFAEALELVRVRGEGMARAAPLGFGMAAILGLGERTATALIARVNEQTPLYLAGINASTEIVVSGADAALERVIAAAHDAGGRGVRLRVSTPSHSPLMDEVSVRLRALLRGITLAVPRVPYVSNHRARVAGSAAEVADDLALNVSRTVRWHDSVTLLYELGCRVYIEPPPGKVLSNLVRSSFPDARVVALELAPLASAVAAARERG
ncbi:MAG TPA: malonate decarboxylase subunit epsilon [Steroidobacteraceae bacterium]|jgi:malonate decarboxylase epsilon subunit|nr:malonate decarboxylase subunit epsilon [Steroidobacteraceae bacterium]